MNKQRIIILGFSNFVQKKLFKSLDEIKNLDIEICSKKKNKSSNKYIFYKNYKMAIDSNPDMIYISLINSLHFKFAKLALKKKIHVIVDKPLTINHKNTETLLSLAKKNKVLLAEATFFNYHNAFKKVSEICGGFNKIKHVQANFNVPQTKNDKLLKKISGDCFQDMAPYCAALLRILFNKQILKKNISSNFVDKNNINKSFYVYYFFKNKSFFGNFGINMEYLSQIVFYSKNKIISINHKSFALPSDSKVKLSVKSANISKEIYVEKDDCVKNFMNKILIAIKKKNYNLFYNLLYTDSKIRSLIKK